MIRNALIVAALMTGWSSLAEARVIRQSESGNLTAGSVGLGLQLGCPTGGSLKARLSPANSFQAEIGFGCGEDLIVAGDYILEMGNFLVDPHNLQVSWFLGIGGRYAYTRDWWGPTGNRHWNNVDLGPRVPLGVEFHFSQLKPLEAYLEIAPGIDFVDDPGVTVDAAVGARWFF